MMGHIFIWRAPRTAGSSLYHGLKLLGIQGIQPRLAVKPLPAFDPTAVDYVACKHYTPADMVGRGAVTETEIMGGTNLMCGRNTWDRLVSTFALLRSTGWHRPGWAHWRGAGDERFAEYVDWATSPVRETDYHPRNFQCQLLTDQMFIEGRRLPLHVLGHFEDLPAYWRAVCKVFGVEGDFPQTNGRAHRPYREMYTPELRDQVAEFYAAEIEEFGYEF